MRLVSNDLLDVRVYFHAERRTIMNTQQREKLLDYNEALCNQYNETEDEKLLEKILATELLLFQTIPISNVPLDIEKDI